MITFVTHPIGIARQLFTLRLPIPGIAPKILIRAQSSPDWISFCAVNSLTTCQCLLRPASCTTRRRMLPLKSSTCCVEIIAWKGSNWAKNPMDNGLLQRIMPHCMLELPGVLAALKSPLKVGGPSLQNFEDQLLTWAERIRESFVDESISRIHSRRKSSASIFCHSSSTRSTTSAQILRRICWKSRSASAR